LQGVVDSTLTFATNLTIGQSGFAWLNSTDILATDGFSNNGETRVTGDSVLFADVTNEGLMAVHLGTLYLIGDLTNNGALLGDVNTGPGFRGLRGGEPQAGDGFYVSGNFAMGRGATLSLPEDIWKLSIGGDFNCAVDNPNNFNVVNATIEMKGAAQTFEMMSTDFGAVEDGFDQSNFTIGSLQIASGSTLQLVDAHDNSEGGSNETMYVDSITIQAGATLLTNGMVVYTHQAQLDGSVDDEGNIIIIEENPADLNGDGIVNVHDILMLIGAWGPCPDCSADINNDDVVNIHDLLIMIGAWG